MKRILIGFLFLQFFYACNNSSEQQAAKPEGDLDAARTFIQNALDGKYDEDRSLLLQDSVNIQLLNAFKDNYENRMGREEKENYKKASITFYETRKPADSITIVNYSNTYKNKKDSLKLIQVKGQWLVDLKYSYFHPIDSSKHVQ